MCGLEGREKSGDYIPFHSQARGWGGDVVTGGKQREGLEVSERKREERREQTWSVRKGRSEN